MGIREQLDRILSLLDAANIELKEWIEAVELDDNYSKDAIESTKSLISDIDSLIHDVGF